MLPYYDRRIKPEIIPGRTLIVAAHGNSLRALVMHLDRLSTDQVLELNIPTGGRLLYKFDKAGEVVSRRYL